MPLDVVGGSLMDDVDPAGLVVDPSHLASNLSLPSPSPSMTPVTPSGSQGSDQEWNYDPNEPRYCVCNQVNKLLLLLSISNPIYLIENWLNYSNI